MFPACANFQYLSTNGFYDDDGARNGVGKGLGKGKPCPEENRAEYLKQIKTWNIDQTEYIWRAAVSAGALPALMAFILSRYLLVETPRFTAHVKKDYQKTITDLAAQGEDWTEEAIAAVMRDQENEEDKVDIIPEHQVPEISFCGFLYHYSWHLIAASLIYSVVNFVFYGQCILIEPAIKILGYNKTQGWQRIADEQFG